MFAAASDRAMAWEAFELRSTRRRHVDPRRLHHMDERVAAPAKRSSADALAGAADALVELSSRGLGLCPKIPMEHRLERLIVTNGERVVAGLVMRAHQKAVRL